MFDAKSPLGFLKPYTDTNQDLNPNGSKTIRARNKNQQKLLTKSATDFGGEQRRGDGVQDNRDDTVVVGGVVQRKGDLIGKTQTRV